MTVAEYVEILEEACDNWSYVTGGRQADHQTAKPGATWA